jgi:beta-aspartyl-peptidase (threonine type)
MRKVIIILCFLINKANAQTLFPTKPSTDKKGYVLVIHGGAGDMQRGMVPASVEKIYLDALNSALDTGQLILSNGGTALDAVERVIKVLEDNPLFNAGKGSVFNSDGKCEMDAAIMNGQNLAAGSVAGVTTIKNPISAARAVMEKSHHVMMTGKGAEKFAGLSRLTIVPESYFFTENSLQDWLQTRRMDSLKEVTKDTAYKKSTSLNASYSSLLGTEKYGTVGAVALDMYGNLAAATSTGGMTNKKYGRVGDSPIIGAGTYANNKTAAISCTGHGEYFIRLVMAKTISDMMEFGNYSLSKASEEMIMNRLPALSGSGGIIAVDKEGNIAMPFCTSGMFRGFVKSNGERQVKLYKD